MHHYLKFEKGLYVIHDDASYESSGYDTNPALSLGMVRNSLDLAVDMSRAMGIDKARHEKWNHILTHLSEWPTQTVNGKTVFRLAEKGADGYPPSSLSMHQVYPGNGIENLSTVPNTINEMLCMSAVAVGSPTRRDSLLRLFPVWPKDKNARFVNIRNWGAFLVSAQLNGGVISGVKIHSEKGRDCTVLNPWPGKEVQVIRNGKASETLAGTRFRFKTAQGETIELKKK